MGHRRQPPPPHEGAIRGIEHTTCLTYRTRCSRWPTSASTPAPSPRRSLRAPSPATLAIPTGTNWNEALTPPDPPPFLLLLSCRPPLRYPRPTWTPSPLPTGPSSSPTTPPTTGTPSPRRLASSWTRGGRCRSSLLKWSRARRALVSSARQTMISLLQGQTKSGLRRGVANR